MALPAYAHPVLILGAYILFVQEIIPGNQEKLQPPKEQLAGKGAAVHRQTSVAASQTGLASAKSY